MISLGEYSRQLHHFATTEVEDHLVRSVFAPLGLDTQPSSSSAARSVYAHIFCLPPWSTNVRGTGHNIAATAAEHVGDHHTSSCLSQYSIRTLDEIGLPFCLSICPTTFTDDDDDDDDGITTIVVVNCGCAEAVLRGSDVFAPGIITANRKFGVGERVRLAVLVEVADASTTSATSSSAPRNTFARGSSLPDELYSRSNAECVGAHTSQHLVRIGDGTAMMEWRAVMKTGARGVAVCSARTPRRQPSRALMDEWWRDAQHAFFLQNFSSMIPVMLLASRMRRSTNDGSSQRTPLRLLDLCGAPGGKSSLLLSLMMNHDDDDDNDDDAPPHLIVCERSHTRHRQMQQLMAEHFPFATNELTTRCVDANALVSEEHRYHGIVLDPPCTGLGLRPKLLPHPHSLTSITTAADYQRRLFHTSVELLDHTPGVPRVIAYSTCTITMEENEANVLFFLKTYAHLRLARASTPEEVRLCSMSEGVGGAPSHLLAAEMMELQRNKEAALGITDAHAPLLVLRLMPPTNASTSAHEDGVGFFVAVFLHT